MNEENKKRLKALVNLPFDATFTHYRAGHLYYHVGSHGNELTFAVPISDIGEATFEAKIKPLLLMRYIRKHLEDVEAGLHFQ